MLERLPGAPGKLAKAARIARAKNIRDDVIRQWCDGAPRRMMVFDCGLCAVEQAGAGRYHPGRGGSPSWCARARCAAGAAARPGTSFSLAIAD